MDDPRRDPYVCDTIGRNPFLNLLLLLSALLSALTGVVGGVQRLQVSPALERSIDVAAVRKVAALATRRPAAAVTSLGEVAAGVAPMNIRFAPAAPLWASRPRI